MVWGARQQMGYSPRDELKFLFDFDGDGEVDLAGGGGNCRSYSVCPFPDGGSPGRRGAA